MPYVITEPCVGRKDGACVQACPCDCIHPKLSHICGLLAETTQLYINPNDCIECGMCVEECPVQAIYQDHEVPAKWAHYVRINAEHFAQGS